MTTEVALETGRQRPQSGGFRTFLSWLKRDERLNDRTSSKESISSCGSDNTVTSFAFLSPAYYKTDIEPIILPPPGPPTDSYRKRIKDRNIRLHLDRDLTLCRKYNLTAEPINYDAFSLPNERRILNDLERGRRATSVYIQRRAPYVPGKRRAPAPPIRASSLGPINAPFNRKSRKRQAPQPPKLEDKENIKVIGNSDSNTPNKTMSNSLTEPQNKLIKNEAKEIMDQIVEHKKSSTKVQSERSFLKQIFEGKKRISVCDPVAVRLLPSISELDRQAAEIMQMKLRNDKLKKRQNDALVKDMKSASNNIPEENLHITAVEMDTKTVIKQNNQIPEKQELKNILKEMKDSLPKRTKPSAEETTGSKYFNTQREPTTLRVVDQSAPVPGPSWQWSPLAKTPHNNGIPDKKSGPSPTTSHNIKPEKVQSSTIQLDRMKQNNELQQNLPTTLATTNENIKSIKEMVNEEATLNNISRIAEDTIKNKETVKFTLKSTSNKQVKTVENFNNDKNVDITHSKSIIVKDEKSTPLPSTSSEKKKQISSVAARSNSTILSENKETRRKELIFELEKCIVEGNEEGAAKKATELAQLGISGTVLSDSLLKTKVDPNTSSDSNKIENKPCDIVNVCDVMKETPIILINEIIQKVDCSGEVKRNPISNEPVLVKDPVVPRINSNSTSSSSTVEAIRKIIDENKQQIRERAKIPAPDLTRLQMDFEIKVYIESRKSRLGPALLYIQPTSTLGQLKAMAEKILKIPVRLQRWVVGKTLCNNDNMVLAKLAGPKLTVPFYLCIVQPDEENQGDGNMLMQQLIQLENQAIIYNKDTFECEVCMMQYKAGKGVVLRECVHTFCKECVSTAIQYCDSAEVHCPQVGCFGILQDREIRSLVSAEEYEKYLARSLAAAENKSNRSFHCRTKDCNGWAVCDPEVTVFPCPVCKKNNCIPCEAIHEGVTCVDHKRRVAQVLGINAVEDKDTKALLKKMIDNGEGLHCPECNNILTKQYGCDWVLCIACRTEICWVTRGRRWGPKGTGDTSGGCRCGVNGKKCHASCTYCH